MAAIENLEIVVDVDISSALAALEELQEELQDIAETIEAVDARGTEGIDIATSVDNLDSELAGVMAEIEAFEASQSIDIPMDVHDRSFEEILGRAGAGSVDELAGTFQDDMLAAFQGANLDFGGFNVPRGRGIDGGGGGDRGGIFSSLRERARRLSNRFSNLTDRLGGFRLRMSDIHNLFASLVPLLGVFLGAIPAVITAFYGVAAAAGIAAASLAAMAGLGALGVGLVGGQFSMDRLTQVWQDIKDSFIEAFAPLAERLQPLFEDAIDGLGRFFQAIANQGDALMALTDQARAFGSFLMDFVPGALETLAATLEALSPILSNIGSYINENFNSFMRQLTRFTAMAVPVVSELVQTFVAALPTLISIGIQFAQIATILLRMIGVLWRIITLGGALDGVMGTLIGTLLVAATAFSLANTAALRFALTGLWSGITALYRFMVALATASTQMTIFGSTTLASAVSALIGFTASLFSTIAGLIGFSLSAYQATIAAAAFWTAVTLGAAAFLLPMITGMAAGFLGLSNNIDKATSSLKEFDRVAGNTGGGFNPYGGASPAEAADVGGSGGPSRGTGGKTVINIESSGDGDEDRSNARYAGWRQGRNTGGNN